VQKKTVHIRWEIPLEQKVYEEIGKVMVHILPIIDQVEYADSEGAIIQVILLPSTEQETEEWVKEMREALYYVDVWLEGEDYQKVQMNRIMRWANKMEEEE
jgi:hypothetical protein